MKLFAFALFVGVCAAGRLDRTYLPPSSAQGAGGSAQHLNAPAHQEGKYSQEGQYQSGPQKGAAAEIPIVKYENEPNAGDGAYSFEYETANGIKQQEQGHSAGQDEQIVDGSVTYTAPDGMVISMQYKADANGFQPEGEHLPTSPPIPDVILKSIQINAAAEAAGYKSGPAQGQGYQSGAAQGQGYQSGPAKPQGFQAATAQGQAKPSFGTISDSTGYKY